jgi:probable rRNA maturation factor
LRIVGSVEGRLLNSRYRRQRHATNVLSFGYDMEPSSRQRKIISGDIVLCAPVIAREARAQRKTLAAHYAHLTVHGMLHLQGYDHQRDSDANRMERLETAILERLGWANPYLPDAFANGPFV